MVASVKQMTSRARRLRVALDALAAGRDVVLVSFYRVDAFDLAAELVAMAKKGGTACANVKGSPRDAPRVRIREFGDAAYRPKMTSFDGPIGWPVSVFFDESCRFERGCYRAARARSVYP
jgi:hypothetical protein